MKTASKSNAKYNKSNVFKNAWRILRTDNLTWSECLKQAWNIEKNGMAIPTIEVIMQKYYQQIFNHVLYKVKNRENAEEITQDVFVKCNEHLAIYDVERAKLTTWLYTNANTKVIDFYRTEHNRASHYVSTSNFVNSDGEEFFDFVDTENLTEIERNELMTTIYSAFESLKPKYREVAELNILSQKKYEEIANILDIPLNTVKVTLKRAKEMLMNELREVYQLTME